MDNHKIRVAITQGDTNGIGLELIIKAFNEPDILELCTPIIYSSQKIIASYGKELGLNPRYHIIANARDAREGKVNLVNCIDKDIEIHFGASTQESSLAGIKALDQALADYNERLVDVLVCTPMEQNLINAGGYKFANQTKYIEATLGNDCKPHEIYLNEMIRMAVVTNTSDMREVAKDITTENVQEKIVMMHKTLKRDFRLSNPRIAVLALNPTANGAEEEKVIAPLVTELSEKGVQVFGPYQAEEFFGTRQYEAFDGILAMYHDQAMLPIRMTTDSSCVKLLTNMPLVCTMPDCGTQMNIAGKNIAEPSILYNAVFAAIDVYRFRKEHDAPLGNPLPKLYHERPDNGEKLRFSIPKKREE